MRKMLKEFALGIGGVGLGLILFAAATNQFATFAFTIQYWGYPLPWLYRFEPDFIGYPPYVTTTSVAWGAFFEDLAFWLSIPIVAIELSAHVGVPYIMRVLKLRREKRRTTATSAYGFFETPK